MSPQIYTSRLKNDILSSAAGIPPLLWVSRYSLSGRLTSMMLNRRTAVPHRITVDDRYREYDIPAGCMVIPNVWSVIHAFREHPATTDTLTHFRAMSRDAKYFPEPEEFRPERHLEGDAEAGNYVLPSSFVFGFGCRCVPTASSDVFPLSAALC